MKNVLLSIAILFSLSVKAQWSTVGIPHFSNSSVSHPFITTDPNGTPYITFCNHSTTGRVTVMKYNGSNWVYVGTPGFSAGDADGTTMDFDNNGTPHVAFTDGDNNSKTSVMKFDGNSWVYVGPPGFTPGTATFNSLAIDENGTPYVAYRDQGDTLYSSWPNGFRASVMKFNGTNWEYVGNPGFSAGSGPYGALYTSLIFDNNNIPYVAYADFSNDFKATVMKFDGGNWVYVGAAGFSEWQANNTSIVFDSYNVPYVAFVDRAYAGKATVMKFDESNWVTVGGAGLSPGGAEYTSLAIDINNVLYLSFKDYANHQRASVMKFDGINWVQVGSPGFSAPALSEVYKPTIAIDKNNGILYVAYDDVRYDSTWSSVQDGPTVMKYETSVTSLPLIQNNPNITLSPNPTPGPFTLTTPTPNTTITIYDVLGNCLLKKNCTETSPQFDLSNQSKGIYFVEVVAEGERAVKKIILN